MTRGRPITPERLAILKACIDDGWPIIEIKRTHGIAQDTIKRHFPDYRGIPQEEVGPLGNAQRRATLAARKLKKSTSRLTARKD